MKLNKCEEVWTIWNFPIVLFNLTIEYLLRWVWA